MIRRRVVREARQGTGVGRKMAILWGQLGVATVVILGASLFLAKSADVIAIKTGLGRTFRGGGVACDGDVAAGAGDGGKRGCRPGGAGPCGRRGVREQPFQSADNRVDGHLLVEPVPVEPRGDVVGRGGGAGHRGYRVGRVVGAGARHDGGIRRVASQPSVDRTDRGLRSGDVLRVPVREGEGPG